MFCFAFFLTLTVIQFINFLSVIVTQAQSLANGGFFIRWHYCGNVPIFAERKLAVMHHTLIVIWLAKARAQISRVLLEIASMFYEWKTRLIYHQFHIGMVWRADLCNYLVSTSAVTIGLDFSIHLHTLTLPHYMMTS